MFDGLESVYKNYPASMSRLAQKWIEVGIITGIRPNEWKNTKIRGNVSDFYYSENHDQVLRMVVQNAKYSKGKNRSNGKHRTLIMTSLSEQDIIKILDFNSLLQKHIKTKGGFEEIYYSVRKCLYYANQKTLPKSSKYITLYSARHQFVSDRKSMNEHPAYTAALLGHASIKTAQSTYGRKTSGKSRFSKVIPLDTDVKNILKNTPKSIMNEINRFSFKPTPIEQ
ncbi:site-specific integrase [Isorropodon fossajaponicum symbiont]|uniref:site-specific integrase n=1 Tax=Isorropodon fossajaponicum symbiont TaxID=883811 RepID=UPI001915FBF1|nr:site-specific integrase [Isorropodon fossajaponicum symbiont]